MCISSATHRTAACAAHNKERSNNTPWSATGKSIGSLPTLGGFQFSGMTLDELVAFYYES